jgi:DNA-directed RNA polymerase
MTKTLDLLVQNMEERQKFLLDIKGEKPDKRNKAWHLHDADCRELILHTYGHVLAKIEILSELTNMLSSIGNSVNRKLKLKLDEVNSIHLGWFVFISYLDTGILSIKKKRSKKKNGKLKKHSSYHIQVDDVKSLNSVLEELEQIEKVEMFPSPIRPAHWIVGEFNHDTGFPLIKKSPHEDAVKACKEGGTEYLVDTLNKLGDVGWRINHFIFNVFKSCKYLDSVQTPFKFQKEVDPKKKASLLIEAEAIEAIAERNKENAFYHLYNVDFRGRIYPNTAFLHEQSSDNAKGLLLLDEPVKLGQEGLYWLMVHTANMFGNDKVTLDERSQFVIDNWNKFISYVEDPMGNDSWMSADKPFCFLACCYEIYMIDNWVNDRGLAVEEFPSNLPVYVDGSNNGVQHLVAMSKDEEVAPLVNLVPQELPGDVYMFIADKVIDNVTKDYDALISEDSDAVEKYTVIYNEFVKLEKSVNNYSSNSKSDLFSEAMKRRSEFGNLNRHLLTKYAPIYWYNIKDRKIWRKTVKRPVMTLGYGAVQYGMVDMVHDDTRSLNLYLRDKHKAWSAYLGQMIYRTCYAELKGPAAMLRMFENLGAQENGKNKPINFRQIVTGLPFVHAYRKGLTKTVKLNYNNNRMELDFTLWAEATLDKDKQKQSAPPNIVHSVDAVHLSMYVHDTDYPVTVVHDSFGCHAGNMDKAFVDVRNKFVELYDMNPLEHIFSQMNALQLIPQKGTLDVKEIIDSDYAFA